MYAPLGTLGEIVAWKAPSQVKFTDLKAALAASGLDDSLAKDMVPRNAFSRAAHKMEKDRIIRQTEETDDYLVFQFTAEHLYGGEYSYSKETDLKLHKASGRITCPIDELRQQAQDLLDAEMEVRRSNDITRIIQKVFDIYRGDLISIREQGGCYFVPEMHRNLIDNIDSFLLQVGGKLRRFSVSPDNDSTSDSVAESMAEHFKQMIDEFKLSCDTVTEESSAAVTQRRTKTLMGLRLKLDAYKDLLRDYAEQINEGVSDAERLLEAKLNGGYEPDEEPDEEPETVAAGGGMSPTQLLLQQFLS